jgi:hypothetical protein
MNKNKNLLLFKAVNHVESFFTKDQIQDMSRLLIKDNKKADENLTWIADIIEISFNGSENFEKLGDPPYTYAEVISE